MLYNNIHTIYLQEGKLMAITKTETFFIKEKYFKGDILITDPCYICKDRDESTRPKWDDYIKGEEK